MLLGITNPMDVLRREAISCIRRMNTDTVNRVSIATVCERDFKSELQTDPRPMFLKLGLKP